jgi:hypothetical protein
MDVRPYANEIRPADKMNQSSLTNSAAEVIHSFCHGPNVHTHLQLHLIFIMPFQEHVNHHQHHQTCRPTPTTKMATAAAEFGQSK